MEEIKYKTMNENRKENKEQKSIKKFDIEKRKEQKGQKNKMQQIYALLIGIAVLALGIPIGNMLAKAAKDELKTGKRWFKLIILLSLIGAIVFLILGNDALLFGFLFSLIIFIKSIAACDPFSNLLFFLV